MQSDSVRGVCIVVSLSLNFTTMQTPHTLRLMAALCEEINMIQKVKAKIIGASGSDALAVEWLRENPSEGPVSIGGPLVTHLPLSLVSSELRLPNTLVSVSLSDPYTVVC